MESYVIIVLIFGILILFCLSLLFFINRVFLLKNAVLKQYNVIFEYFIKRKELANEMILLLENSKVHEDNYIKKLKGVIDIIDHEKELSKLKNTKVVLEHFNTLENTYSFLTKSKEYNEIKDKFLQNEDRLIYSSDLYDKSVVIYNDYLNTKLISIIDKVFKFKRYDIYNK